MDTYEFLVLQWTEILLFYEYVCYEYHYVIYITRDSYYTPNITDYYIKHSVIQDKQCSDIFSKNQQNL